jgi:putative LysE/RhtB family amino acid efflux pump
MEFFKKGSNLVPMIIHLMEAWMIGIAIAAPVGPIGTLFIRKTLDLGKFAAVAVGLGAALADSTYGLIAALGLTAVTHLLQEQAILIQVVGGLFLLFLAYKELNTRPSGALKVAKTKTMGRLTLEVYFLTLTSPATVLLFIGIFASIGGATASTTEMFLLVMGIFLGSISWWLFLGTILIKIRHKLSDSWLSRIRYISAIMLGGFGLWAIFSPLLTL